MTARRIGRRVARGLSKIAGLLDDAPPPQAPASPPPQASSQDAEAAALATEHQALTHAGGWFPPGHFYSPIPDRTFIASNTAALFPDELPRRLPGIDLNDRRQLELLEAFLPFRAESPFKPEGQDPALRGVFSNTMYCGTEGTLLHYMMRHLRPKRVVEVGCGYSTCFAFDTNERFFGGQVQFTLVEPYTERLRQLVRPGDLEKVELLESPVQRVPRAVFERLEANDILFIDSTHVAKVGSDVNFLLFEILPLLRKGVFIHIHDVFYPFEYPKDWFEKGLFWNEAYLLRAFLQFNAGFSIAFFHDYMLKVHRERLLESFPLLSWGQSIWLEKTVDP
ncbi:MAG: class I SAM-dependent methyltransferase [Myxococcales bacterium]|nr:class I SAM-dependent methyltransferase [Myxococcales bacterium]MDP3504331.1 class I SAM-dependent methyltransferase [Myxococcales bacterium]